MSALFTEVWRNIYLTYHVWFCTVYFEAALNCLNSKTVVHISGQSRICVCSDPLTYISQKGCLIWVLSPWLNQFVLVTDNVTVTSWGTYRNSSFIFIECFCFVSLTFSSMTWLIWTQTDTERLVQGSLYVDLTVGPSLLIQDDLSFPWRIAAGVGDLVLYQRFAIRPRRRTHSRAGRLLIFTVGPSWPAQYHHLWEAVYLTPRR